MSSVMQYDQEIAYLKQKVRGLEEQFHNFIDEFEVAIERATVVSHHPRPVAKLGESLILHRSFDSQKQWCRKANVSYDTFYRLVINSEEVQKYLSIRKFRLEFIRVSSKQVKVNLLMKF